MESEGMNASIIRAIRTGRKPKPGQKCVCWNNRWDNCFVIGTVRKCTITPVGDVSKLMYEVQSALGGTFNCDHALFYEGPMPETFDEKTDESPTV